MQYSIQCSIRCSMQFRMQFSIHYTVCYISGTGVQFAMQWLKASSEQSRARQDVGLMGVKLMAGVSAGGWGSPEPAHSIPLEPLPRWGSLVPPYPSLAGSHTSWWEPHPFLHPLHRPRLSPTLLIQNFHQWELSSTSYVGQDDHHLLATNTKNASLLFKLLVKP